MDKVLYSVAHGMDAVREGNRLVYEHMGMISFGGEADKADKISAVERLFRQTGIPHDASGDIMRKMWGKLMLNVGVNQTAAVYRCGYEGLQNEGPVREVMLGAMREVLALSEKEGVCLTQADLDYWLGVLDGVSPMGKPSMQQDVEAGRPTEVELFAGTVLRLGKKHGMDFPVNRMLYERIKAMEEQKEL
jgi:2-dehydropantoate 2-reductase